MFPKSLCEWFSYIEALHKQPIALGLERIRIVAQKLKVIDFTCPVITVGGTNGKGSCVAFLEAILTSANYRTGVYTSPHLLQFNERIRIANQPVSDLSLIKAFEAVETARANIALTYFEFTTLAAFYLFQAAKLDVLILEVGLGGRLDAVNLIAPDVSVITSIDLDHMEWLGETREAIGYEKAGICRPHKPVVCGDYQPPLSLLQVAQTLEAPFYCIGRDFCFQPITCVVKPQVWSWQYQNTAYQGLPKLQLPAQSAAAALMALHCLKDRLRLDRPALLQGLQQAFLPGRFQRFDQPREIILDVAHNPAAASYLAKRLKETPTSGKTYAVISILADKDIVGTLQPLLPRVDNWYVAPLQIPRGSTAENIANCLQQLGVNAYDVRLTQSIDAAFHQAIAESQMSDRVLVFGSFHTVAAVYHLCGK